jgi:hypothetical protein
MLCAPINQRNWWAVPTLHISSNCPCWSFRGSAATAESQKSEILGGAQDDKDEFIQSAMIFGNSYECRHQTFPISSGNKVVRKTASIVK